MDLRGGTFLLQKTFTQNKQGTLCNIKNHLLDAIHNQGKGVYSRHDLPKQLLHGDIID